MEHRRLGPRQTWMCQCSALEHRRSVAYLTRLGVDYVDLINASPTGMGLLAREECPLGTPRATRSGAAEL